MEWLKKCNRLLDGFLPDRKSRRKKQYNERGGMHPLSLYQIVFWRLIKAKDLYYAVKKTAKISIKAGIKAYNYRRKQDKKGGKKYLLSTLITKILDIYCIIKA